MTVIKNAAYTEENLPVQPDHDGIPEPTPRWLSQRTRLVDTKGVEFYNPTQSRRSRSKKSKFRMPAIELPWKAVE